MLTMSKERELGVLKGLEGEGTIIKPREFFESNQTISKNVICKSQVSLFPHNKTYIETNQIEIWKMSNCGKKTHT